MRQLCALVVLLSSLQPPAAEQGRHPENWASRRITLSISLATVSDVVARLHSECIPLSFIESSTSRRIDLSAHDADVNSVLNQVQAQAPEYVFEVVNARPVLYSSERKFQALLQNDDLSRRPRLEAADRLVQGLRKRVQGFDRLLEPPVVTLGGSHFPIYDDLVEQRKQGRVIEHLVDLLGPDLDLYLTFESIRESYYSIGIQRLDCKSQKIQ